MIKKSKFYLMILSLIFSGCFFITLNAYALESLNFQGHLGTISKSKIKVFLKDAYQADISNYSIASHDLNNDGLDEYILKSSLCTQSNIPCDYVILAEKGKDIIELSKITAKNILVSGTYSYGIKDILVFQNEINDYDFDIYMWSSKEKMYIVKQSM